MRGIAAVIGSLLWSAVNAIRFAFFRLTGSKTIKLSAKRVISVGNIQAGGSGKTPLVRMLAEIALSKGLSVAILTRGYRSAWESAGGVLKPREFSGQSVGASGGSPDPALCGDEPALLWELLGGKVWIGVGSDRVKSYERLVLEKGVPFDWVLLDDGFQKVGLWRDVDLVALTGLKSTQVLFREFKCALKRAHGLLLTKGLQEESELLSVPAFPVSFRTEFLGESPTKGRSLWLVTAVAFPGLVKYSVEKDLGFKVEREFSLRDHAAFSKAWAEGILSGARAEGAAVVMTGKDFVKWKSLGISQDLSQGLSNDSVFVIESRAAMNFKNSEEEKAWEKLLWGA